jgi:hypothetical protein
MKRFQIQLATEMWERPCEQDQSGVTCEVLRSTSPAATGPVLGAAPGWTFEQEADALSEHESV